MNNLEKLFKFIDESPSAYHSVENAGKILKSEGFIYIPVRVCCIGCRCT